jgi:hypothetical protein
MIYLIDDKNLRQKDFGWSEERFDHFSNIIKPLYKIDDILQIGEDLYFENNIILYHESFLDFTSDKDKALRQREKLTKIAATSPKLSVAFFSGSQGARTLSKNIAYLPVSTVYQNLEILINQHYEGSLELKYLLFGEHPEIEEELNEKLTQANRNLEEDAVKLTGETLFFHPDEDFIQNAIIGSHNEEIYTEKDAELTEIILNLLNENEYDNIFLPLCFGQTLSDFNGLRLAAHIRCTPTKNRLKRIFIYGFVGLDYLLEHEYFNILKTKNIQLVSYSKKAFGAAAKRNFDSLKPEELSKEIKKLKLDPPLNYADSHSIANEWAIHQWAKTIGCDETEELKSVFKNVSYSLYFKYLRTKYSKGENSVFPAKKLKIDYEGKPKVLLIDDEAEKGWYEIFAFLLGDLNNIYTDYLGVDFKNLSSDEIIEKSIDKIFSDDIDIVILDFRLNPSDFEKIKSDEITSLKLLKELKKINPGVQVVIFSATNKAWNLQALQDAQADGFIFKDGSRNNFEPESTLKGIESLISVLNNCFDKIFLKGFYSKLNELKNTLIPRKNFKKSDAPLPKEFVDETLKWLELSCEVLKRETSQSMITASFIFMFSVLENLSNRLINVDDPIPLNENNNQQLYMFEFRGSNQKLKRFKEDENNLGFYRRTNSKLQTPRNIPWKFKILNALDFITDNKMKENELSLLIKKRNDLIHANSTTGEKFTINIELLITLNSIIHQGLINVK